MPDEKIKSGSVSAHQQEQIMAKEKLKGEELKVDVTNDVPPKTDVIIAATFKLLF